MATTRDYLIEVKPIAIYNRDAQRLEYVTISISEASKIIFGISNVSYTNKIRYAIRNDGRIDKSITILGHNLFIREATVKQIEQLGKEKFIKIEHGT